MKYSDLSKTKETPISTQDYTPNTYYPYGELPFKYTKQGQEKIKNDSKNKIETLTNDIDNNANDSQNNNSLDFKALLPLLSNIGGNDTINQILPLLNGNADVNINDLLKLFTTIKKTSTTTSEKTIITDNYIDNLKVVK